ncbi:FkbM family methyltransferase [Sphingomonas nostoxanthinifaciens]|uniref:FkbM family methyltransferase n=1 Tax=Sphingomonas nostoxanthinifaciens TaxID=2872652 RepID=UPI001CC22011|nr:FkbM family methyltransferase [Sphingomonas nostoxanthinifaciens]UAK23023.1 FkbM family methyltransferase [Sphingomonas nostoxanthinifaciens]
MAGSIAVRAGYMALAMGARLPRSRRLQDVHQQSRTIDEIKRHGIDVVLDVGANRGFYARHLRMLGYRGTILSFEPDAATFAHLEAQTTGDPGWRGFNCALGEAAGTIVFNVIRTGPETVLSSALTFLHGAPSAVTEVPVRTVAEVLDAEGIGSDARIFLKMDTQGYDLRVFAGASNHPGIRLLQSELSVEPLYVGMPHYTDALACYEDAGFELLDLFVVSRTERGSILEYDALMTRRA